MTNRLLDSIDDAMKVAECELKMWGKRMGQAIDDGLYPLVDTCEIKVHGIDAALRGLSEVREKLISRDGQ